MLSSKEKLIFDSYVEGYFANDDLIKLIERHSKILEGEIYRGIFIPNILLKVGNDINKCYPTKVMSFSKNLDIAKKFARRVSFEDYVIAYLKKKGYNMDSIYEISDNSFFSKAIIILRNQRSFDLYANYENKAYQSEKEVLVLTEPLYIRSIFKENDLTFINCVNEAEFFEDENCVVNL